MAIDDQGSIRRARLASARLYLVCPETGDQGARTEDGGRADGGSPAGEAWLESMLASAIAGGVDIVQLREKHLSDEELLALARPVAELCSRLGALLVVNDRPLVAREAGADGVHVGQQDMPPAEVRELVGPDMLIGLSTHAPEEVDATDAAIVDYIGVGPIHETPTKPGRPAVGLGLIAHAARHAPVPFFAIGGLDEANVSDAIAAGASRVCVLRWIAASEDPERAARGLCDRLDAHRPER